MNSLKKTSVFAFAALVLLAFSPVCGICSDESQRVSELIKSRLLDASGRKALHGQRNDIEGFYGGRNFEPAWSDGHGPLPIAFELIRTIRECELDGLRPENYGIEPAEDLLLEVLRFSPAHRAAEFAELDIELTDAFISYGQDLYYGQGASRSFHDVSASNKPKVDLVAMLDQALRRGSLAETVKGLYPRHTSYGLLRWALEGYMKSALSGGWPVVPHGATLRTGDTGYAVSALRDRLTASGDLPRVTGARQDLFDEGLGEAVMSFQKRHGLRPDGIAGEETVAEMNVPVWERIRQIQLSLERLRWLPRNLGRRYILVNITDFGLEFIKGMDTILTMRVIVGKPFWDTPAFSSRITHIVLNPAWNIPKSIAVEEFLPGIKEDPDYLTSRRIAIINTSGTEPREIEQSSIDWSGITEDNFPFRLRQAPGPGNPLGVIKFVLPNRYSIYLHDTPSGGLFNRTVRTFSHSCIRLEKPLELAAQLLQGSGKWSVDDVYRALDRGTQKILPLDDQVDVHLVYLTAWVRDGVVHFRQDIYGRDQRLYNALQ